MGRGWWQRVREHGPLAFVAVAGLLGALLIARGTPLWWVGGALWLSGLSVLRTAHGPRIAASLAWLSHPRTVPKPSGRTFVPATALLEGMYVLMLAVVACQMMADLWVGERPVSHDHTVHYFKAWQLHAHVLDRGVLYGWSHRMFSGYPVNYLYPIGADLWVNLVHALGFGLLSFSRAYGLAFALFHLLLGIAGYRFGRSLGGPHVGFVTGLLLLTDMAEFRLGGWAYTVEYGVWPQALSLAFGLLALSHVRGVIEGRGAAAIGAFGLWMGFAIVTHPVQLIFLAMLFALSAIAAGFADGVCGVTAMVRLGAGYAVAFWIALLWLLPFMDTRQMTDPMGIWWDSTYEMGEGLLNLSSLPGTLGYVLAFGMLGLVVAFKSRRFIVLLTAMMALFIPVVCSSTFVDEFRLPVLSAAFTKVQFLRMGTMVKPFWFALAGYFLVLVLRHARSMLAESPDRRDRSGPYARPALRAGALSFVAGLLVLPISVPALSAFWTSHVDKSLRTVNDRQFLEDRKALRAWLLENLPDDGFYRLGILTGHNHDLIDLATEIDRPIYKRGFTPCTNFIYKMRSRERAVLEAVNLRFAIAKKSLPSEDFEQIKTFGIYRVFRFRHYRPDPFEVFEGTGDVQLITMDDEEIVLDAAPGAQGSLRLSVSWFPRWRAFRDGQPVPMRLTYVREEPDATGFMTVPLAPGRYRFVFQRSLLDQLAVPFGLAGVAFACFLIWSERRGFSPRWVGATARVLDGFSGPALARVRLWGLLTLASALVLVSVMLSEWRPAIELDEALKAPPVQRVRYDFLESMRDALVWFNYRDRQRLCTRMGDRFICPDHEGNLSRHRFVGSDPTTIEEYRMVRCIRARPEHRATLKIRYPRVPRGDALVGYYGTDFEGRLLKRRRPVRFGVEVDGSRVYRNETETDDKMYWFRVPLPRGDDPVEVTFNVQSPNVRKRWFCFYAQVVDF